MESAFDNTKAPRGSSFCISNGWAAAELEPAVKEITNFS